MNDLPPERPKRRVRYSGKNPRHFHEKYKEHAPDRFAEDVAKVIASGKTPAGTHRPIMVREILEILRPQPGEIAVDCTLGYGGHATELLKAIQPDGRLIAVDADPVELPKTEARMRQFGFAPESLLVRRMNYAGVAQLIAQEATDGADVLLADLGLSSMQIDNPARGFTFKIDAPLDMRMNPTRGQSATELLSKTTAQELAAWLTEYADEPYATAVASAIIQSLPVVTTTALAQIVRRTVPSSLNSIAAEDSVRRTFQAIRIAVNDELGALKMFLRNLPGCLKHGGRVAILTFHSGEDRLVKHAFKDGLRDGVYSTINDIVTRASSEEQHNNSRSRPAKLRWAIKAH